MTEKLIVDCCAPTLAGLKTGSMFGCDYNSPEELMCSICKLNKRLKPRGVAALPLRLRDGKALVYIYRPVKLKQDLNNSSSREILDALGYEQNTNKCLEKLILRMRNEDLELNNFPHEVGLFLGYPPDDVKAFIENNGKGYNCVGRWKSYSEPAKAEEVFKKFQKCTCAYKEALAKGATLEKLAIKGRI